MSFNFVKRPKSHWGSSIWSFLHTIAIIDSEDFDIRKKQVDDCVKVLRGIEYVIPCHKCIPSWKDFVESLSNQSEIYENMGLFRLLHEFHNRINIKLGKPILTYNDAVSLWCREI